LFGTIGRIFKSQQLSNAVNLLVRIYYLYNFAIS
jgi:hypothetical protein